MLFFSQDDDETQQLSRLWKLSPASGTKQSQEDSLSQIFFEFYVQGEQNLGSLSIKIEEQRISYFDGKNTKYFPLLLTSLQDRYFLNKGKKTYMLKLINIKNQMKANIFTSCQQPFIRLFTRLSTICVLRNPNENYKMLDRIASTTFGEVCNAIQLSTDMKVVAKICKKQKVREQNAMTLLQNQIVFLNTLKKQGVSPLIKVYENYQNIIFIMHKAEGGTLLDYIKQHQSSFNITLIKEILMKTLKSLQVLHKTGIIHRDIKPSNILFKGHTNCQLFINDFGISMTKKCFYNQQYQFFNCGTIGFAAPEVIAYDVDKGSAPYDEKSDIFSFGCIMYFLLKGKTPVQNLGTLSQEKMKQQIFSKISRLNTPESAKQLLFKVLDPNPNERISAQKAQEHAFFNDSKEWTMYRFSRCEFRNKGQQITQKIRKQWLKYDK